MIPIIENDLPECVYIYRPGENKWGIPRQPKNETIGVLRKVYAIYKNYAGGGVFAVMIKFRGKRIFGILDKVDLDSKGARSIGFNTFEEMVEKIRKHQIYCGLLSKEELDRIQCEVHYA